MGAFEMQNFDEQALNVTITMILNTGTARSLISGALSAIADYDYQAAHEKMHQANANLQAAYSLQARKLHEEAATKVTHRSVLFVHAQDTLNGVTHEFQLAERLIGAVEGRWPEKLEDAE